MSREFGIATLNISDEPIRVYVYQGRVPLHCGVCGKQMLPGDEYTRHQSPTRWSMSGKHWDDVEIGLRRTSVKPYIACSSCYGFRYDQETPPQDTDAIDFARLDQVARTGELILDTIPTTVFAANMHTTPVPEKDTEDDDPEATIRVSRVVPIWKINTIELGAVRPNEAAMEKGLDDSWVR